MGSPSREIHAPLIEVAPKISYFPLLYRIRDRLYIDRIPSASTALNVDQHLARVFSPSQ